MRLTRSRLLPNGAVALVHWRLAADDRAGASDRLLDEALACAGEQCVELLERARTAVRRAHLASRSMRRGSAALRQLERAGVAATEIYLREGRALLEQCVAIEQQLVAAGFPVADRPLPAWAEAVLHDPEAHQNGTSSSATV